MNRPPGDADGIDPSASGSRIAAWFTGVSENPRWTVRGAEGEAAREALWAASVVPGLPAFFGK
ncbi:MAG: hypothetical protein AAF328_02475 [Planctomycetota bacterium]